MRNLRLLMAITAVFVVCIFSALAFKANAASPAGTKLCDKTCITARCDDKSWPCYGRGTGDCYHCVTGGSRTFCAPAASGTCTTNGVGYDDCGIQYESTCYYNHQCRGGMEDGRCKFDGC